MLTSDVDASEGRGRGHGSAIMDWKARWKFWACDIVREVNFALNKVLCRQIFGLMTF